MRPFPLQWAAIAWCVLMVALLSFIQFMPGIPNPPFFLYAIFTGVWVFGAVMLYAFPLFGAAGTTIYGVLLGVQVLNAHGFGPGNLNVLIAVASFVGALLAGLLFVQLRRRRGGMAV